MIRSARWKGLAATLAVAFLLAACGQGGGGGTSGGGNGGGDSSQAPSEIVIGAVLPLTGKEAKPGNYQRLGLQLAAEQVNAQGGVYVKEFDRKLPVRIEILDDETDQTKTVSLLERLASDPKVVALLGGYSTALVKAQAVVPDRYQKPYINGGGASRAIYSQGYKYVFGTLSPITLLGETTMDFLKSLVDEGKLQKGLKIAIAWENTDHGKDYERGIKDWIERNPGYFEVVFSEPFELYASDYTALLQKVKNAGADLFLADAHLEDYITMHRQYTQMGLRHQMISYGARGPEKDAKDALGDATDYVFAGVWWSRQLPYPQAAEFVKAYEEFTEKNEGEKISPEWYSATAYEAARAMFAAIEQAGTLQGPAIRDALAKLRLEGSLMPGQVLTFAEDGQVRLPFVVVQNKPGGKTDIVYPADAKTGDAVAPIPWR